MNGSGDIWDLVLEEQADFGDCRTLPVDALGRPTDLPLKRKGGVKSGRPTSFKVLKGRAESCFGLRQLRG